MVSCVFGWDLLIVRCALRLAYVLPVEYGLVTPLQLVSFLLWSYATHTGVKVNVRRGLFVKSALAFAGFHSLLHVQFNTIASNRFELASIRFNPLN